MWREMPNWVFLLVRFIAGGGLWALMTWIGWRLGGFPWGLVACVFAAPAIGVAIARPLVELTHDGMGWLRHQPLSDWEGRYYAFDGVQVRVLEQGGRLWFCMEDVALACRMRVVARLLPGMRSVGKLPCYTLEAIEDLHRTHPEVALGRFVLWARREVVTPWERRRAGGLKKGSDYFSAE